MLCTFTTVDNRTLVIRSDDIRSLIDLSEGVSEVTWLVGTEVHHNKTQGTAAENAARIQQEELDTISRVEEHHHAAQRRLQAGYPARPVQRGKQR